MMFCYIITIIHYLVGSDLRDDDVWPPYLNYSARVAFFPKYRWAVFPLWFCTFTAARARNITPSSIPPHSDSNTRYPLTTDLTVAVTAGMGVRSSTSRPIDDGGNHTRYRLERHVQGGDPEWHGGFGSANRVHFLDLVVSWFSRKRYLRKAPIRWQTAGPTESSG